MSKFVKISGYVLVAALAGFVALMIIFPHGW